MTKKKTKQIKRLSVEPQKLPDTLSGLLRVAVEDAQLVAKTPGYKLNMGMWMCPPRETDYLRKTKAVCECCMAGSVMACRLGGDPNGESELCPNDFNEEVNYKLKAINEMRIGDFYMANLYLKGNRTVLDEKVIEDLEFVQEEFERYRNTTGRCRWTTYLAAANILEQYGL